MVALIDQHVDAVRAMSYGFVALVAVLLSLFLVNETHSGTTTDIGQTNAKYRIVQQRHRYMLVGAGALTMLMLRGEKVATVGAE
jgi:hypothetical protein